MILVFLSVLPIFPQESSVQPQEAEDTFLEEPELIVLSEVKIHPTGFVNPFFVLKRLEGRLEPGDSFQGLDEFLSRLESIRNYLDNLRIYQSVTFEYEITDQGTFVEFFIVDSWNLLTFPIAMYDEVEREGFITGFLLDWKNFAGTTFDLRSSYGFSTSQWWPLNEIPPNALLSDFQFSLSRLFWGDFSFSFYYRHLFNTHTTRDQTGDILLRYQNFENEAGFRWSTKMKFWPQWLSALNDYSYSQSLGYLHVSDPVGIFQQNDPEQEPKASGHRPRFSHSIGSGDTDWSGNFRIGQSHSFGQNLSFNIESLSLDHSYSLSYFLADQWDWIGYKWSLGLRHAFQSAPSNFAGSLRGAPSLLGYTGLTSRLSFPIRALVVPDFAEFQLWPFIDSGIATDYEEINTAASFGFDVVLYPLFARSFVFRFTIGFNAFNPTYTEIQMMDGLSH